MNESEHIQTPRTDAGNLAETDPALQRIDGRDDGAVSSGAVSDTAVPGAAQQSANTPVDAAHEEYLRETARLVDEEIDTLFSGLQEVAGQAGGGQRATVSRHDRTLTIENGGRRVVCTVEAVTDLPEGSDRAQAFPSGQARATIQAPDGSTHELWLHRTIAGDTAPSYAWMRAETEKPIEQADVTSIVAQLFA